MTPRVLRKAGVVLAGVVVAVGASAVGLALTRTSPSPRHAESDPPSTVGPATRPAGTADATTTVPAATTSTPAGRAASSTTTDQVGTTVLPTTSMTVGPPQCQWSAFTVSVTSLYASGAKVPFTVTARNTGPACTDAGQAGCDCWSAYVEDAVGNVVWIQGAPEPPTSSIKVTSPLQVLRSGWSTTRSMEWNENVCTSSQDCSQTPSAKVGHTYEVFGEWAFHVQAAGEAITSPAFDVTIE
ncbi:MAG: hypothetical protein KGJ77_10665 [Acidobacteriota bacterium]|nr:hypothetical protein [Acidobacteriota bacterium]